MFKKITILITLMLLFAGCGSDKLVGDWKAWRGNPLSNNSQLYVLHIDKSDNGIYPITQERLYYEHNVIWRNMKNGKQVVTNQNNDEILNAKEAITGNPNKMRMAFEDRYGDPKPKWTGIPLKIAQKYTRDGSKGRGKINKDNLPLKDGKLLFNNLYYEKTDKAGIDKEMADWKERLKKLVGKEITSKVQNVDGELKSVITKVTIVENGKEEVFE